MLTDGAPVTTVHALQKLAKRQGTGALEDGGLVDRLVMLRARTGAENFGEVVECLAALARDPHRVLGPYLDQLREIYTGTTSDEARSVTNALSLARAEASIRLLQEDASVHLARAEASMQKTMHELVSARDPYMPRSSNNGHSSTYRINVPGV